MIRGSEGKPYKERLRELGMFRRGGMLHQSSNIGKTAIKRKNIFSFFLKRK